MDPHAILFLSLLLSMVPVFRAAGQPDEIQLSFTRSLYSVNENNGPAQPVLALSQPVDCCSTISVWVNIEEDTAKEGEDFTATSPVQVLFPGGITRVDFDVLTVDNMKLEASKNFFVSIDPLSLPYGVDLGDHPSAEVIIMDDDESTVSFEATRYVSEEGDGHVELGIELTEAIPFNTSLELRRIVDDTTNTTECDYGDEAFIVTIPVGMTTFKYNLPILNDDVYEINETFKVEIASSNHPQITIGQADRADVTIIDDEEPISVSFSQTTFTVNESDENVTVELTLSRPTPCCLHLYVEVEDITANRTIDYGENDATQYIVTFPAGTSCSSFDIPIIDDIESEEDETFRVTIMDMSLPFGTTLGDDFTAEVVIVDDDIYLSFSQSSYEVYEDEGSKCIELTFDKPAFFDMTVELNEVGNGATGNVDYEPGPYYVDFNEGDMSAELCIGLTDDNDLENGEYFTLTINETALPPEVVPMTPDSAIVSILDDEYTYYFNQTTFVAAEDYGYVLVNLTFSTKLRHNTTVQFRYDDLTATANNSNSNGSEPIDYYVAYSRPNFDTVLEGSKYYILNITIVPDKRLEENELFRIYVELPIRPESTMLIQTDVIIMNDDDFIIGFDSLSYVIDTKNNPETPIINFHSFPESYNHTVFFPIDVTIQEGAPGDTAIGSYADDEGDYVYQNYSTTFNGTDDKYPVIIRPVDDNIVEPDEYFTLVFSLVRTPPHFEMVNEIVTVTIYNDDVCTVRIIEKNRRDTLYFSKQLSTNVTVNITYEDGTGNQTMTEEFTAEETNSKNYFPLPDNVIEVEVFVREDFISKLPNLVPGKGERRIKITPVK